MTYLDHYSEPAMHICPCNKIALEAFLHDLAGWSLRSHKASLSIQHSRRFSSRPSARQLEPTRHGLVDNSVIPFDLSTTTQTGDRITKVEVPQANTEKIQTAVREPESNIWRAVTEIHYSSDTTFHSPNLREDGVSHSQRAGDAVVDEMSLSNRFLRDERASESTTAPTLVRASDNPVSRTAVDSRKNRKLRRVEAGIYRVAAEARSAQKSEDDQLQTVLRKLDELEGPKLSRHTTVPKGINASPVKKDAKDSKANRLAKGESKDGSQRTAKAKRESWQLQKDALERKFGEVGWQPRKRLSPDTMEGIRALHASDSGTYCTEALSQHFKVTPEAIRRILRSKWRPNDQEAEDRRNRWERRGVKKWQDMAEQGIRPPVKWRAMGVGSEEGPQEDRVPKRRKKRRNDDHLSWDEVVGGSRLGEDGVSLAERLL